MGDSSVHTSNKVSKDNKDDKKSHDDSNTTVEFSEDEELLIDRMFKLVGERWSLIAGRIPGRTAEEIQKYWTSKYSSSSSSSRRER